MRPFVPRYIRRLEVWNSSKTRLFHTSKSQKYTKSDPSTKKETHNGQVEIAKMEQKPDYSAWSHESLIERVTQLELELKNKTQSLTTTPPPKKSWKKPRIEREFDPSKYSTRLIALKLAYLGKRYNGFEYHIGHEKPLPTIEEELWKAFNKARLIFPKGVNPLAPGEVNWEGCEYSKCGRTDKGVSAFGQVIGIRVRSNRPLAKKKEKVVDHIENLESEPNQEFNEGFEDLRNTNPRDGALEMVSPPLAPLRIGEEEPGLGIEEPEYEDALAFDPVADEIPYVSILNKILPHDIRILAWCPSPPLDFSARFSCRERQYRYSFTQPAFHPIPHHLEQQLRPGSIPRIKDSWLDIAAMREAAKLYEGLHDFRNFCKVDAGKQITNFERRIFFADIEEVKDVTGELSYVNEQHFTPAAPTEGSPKVYTFTLHGSAFLWHQVRHMVAILFLVGQGLEAPSIVSELLDVKKNPCRPTYEMADDTPLVLWDCVFPHENDADRKNALQWHYQGDQPGFGDGKFGPGGLMDDLWGVWRERKIDEILVGSLMGAIASQGLPISELTSNLATKGVRSQKVFDGGNIPRLQGIYIPVMKKPRLRSVEVVNEEYAIKKGFEGSADLRLQGFRRLNIQPQPPIDTLDE